MALTGQPMQAHGRVGPKRRLDSQNNTAPKRKKYEPRHGGKATRPLSSGELLWGPRYTKSLYCSETDKEIFGIRFDKKLDEKSAEKRKSCQAGRLNSVEELKYYGDLRLNAIVALLGSFELRPWKRGRGRKLQLRYGHSISVVATDGVFQVPATGSLVAVADIVNMRHRREKHSLALWPQANGEKKEDREHRAREALRIRPRIVEEDAQIALMMISMVKEMLRSGEQNRTGAWARVISLGSDQIFLYRSWISRQFVETFDAGAGFTIEYRSVPLKQKRQVLDQLECLLAERASSSDQHGGTD
ncbi:hypothetical protein BB8028_0006g11010 [Beauveria bassiana]|uniref:Uncharacterized protein n=1 Tax=Beauveria bassiana TaxID=176275 RepID=A0A2S7YLR4_BEABA|nr:hypothetical protein BB8028_0006g11010 [Beauveria bassiana]